MAGPKPSPAVRLACEPLGDRITPTVTRAVAVGAGPGVPAVAALIDRSTGAERLRVEPFGPCFTGGVRVAVGDITGDGVVDLVAAAGPGAGPRVRCFDGLTGAPLPGPLGSMIPYDPGFRGGVETAVGDTNDDGYADLVTGAGPGGGPHVRVYSGRDGSVLRDFFAYDPLFRGGVCVAAGDVNGDGRADLVTGAGAGGAAHVRAVSGATGRALLSTVVFDPGFRGGVWVGAADCDGDGAAEVVAGAGPGGGPHVRVLNTDGTVRGEFFADDPAARTGVRVAAGDATGDARAEVMTYTGSGGPGDLTTYRADTFEPTSRTAAGGPYYACPAVPEADVVVDWNRAALQHVRNARLAPPVASRLLAITHLAMFDSANGVSGGYEPYLTDLPVAPAGSSAEAAAAAAAHRVLTSLAPAAASRWDGLLAATDLIPEPARTAGLSFGRGVADRHLAERAADGSAAVVPYTPGLEPGDWVPTPPAHAPALLPGWGAVRPFAVRSATQFAPPAPPPLDSAEYGAALAEVAALGRKDGSTRTADQTEVALFWADGAGTVTPPGHWNRIAEVLAVADGGSVVAHARTFAVLNAALADAGITAWAVKYEYDLWRPVTAVRRADADGNPATSADPGWEPLIATPPFPAYTSGHSTFSGAAAAVLSAEYGAVRFATSSDGLVDTRRAFVSLQDAAAEAGESRVYGGIHYPFDNTAGLTSGTDIGRWAASQLMRRVV